MSQTIHLSFYIYAIIFRLSIIIAGIISIYLGYKLFYQGSDASNNHPNSKETNENNKYFINFMVYLLLVNV